MFSRLRRAPVAPAETNGLVIYDLGLRLYCGRAPLDASEAEALARLGITDVVDLRQPREWQAPGRFGAEAIAELDRLRIRRHAVPLPDGEAPAPGELDAAYEILVDVLARREQRIYVHCRAGLQRTAAVLLAYTARAHDLTYETALGQLRARGWPLRPTPAQEAAVRRWLDAHAAFDLPLRH